MADDFIRRSDAAVFFENSKQTMWHKDDIAATISSKKSISAADVVEVVRCKDCKHKFNRRIFGNIMCGRTAIIKNGEYYGLIATGDNQFCSYGERKTSLPEATRQTVLNNFMKGSKD